MLPSSLALPLVSWLTDNGGPIRFSMLPRSFRSEHCHNVKERNLDAKLDMTCTGCTARCTDGLLVTVCIPGKEDVIYENVTPEFVIKILEKHALKNRVLE